MEYQIQLSEIEQAKVNQESKKLREGLNLENNLKTLSEKAKDQLINTISKITVEIAGILDVDTSNLGYGIGKDMGDLNFATLLYKPITEDYSFILLFSEKSLKFHTTPETNLPIFREVSDASLSLDIAHELYHLRQAQKFPKSFIKTMEANNGNMEEYKKDRGEYAARLFSLGYITNRSKANWKEKLGDLVGKKVQESILDDFKTGRVEAKQSSKVDKKTAPIDAS